MRHQRCHLWVTNKLLQNIHIGIITDGDGDARGPFAPRLLHQRA